MKPFDPATQLEGNASLDQAAGALSAAAAQLPQETRDLLHGVWKGTPLHPTLTDVTVGTWLSASVLDLLPGNRRGATALIATGLASSAPTALSGLADFAMLHPRQKRVGVAHAAGNGVALLLYAGSLLARMRGRHWRGRLLSTAGLAALTASGQLGGHLSYRQAAGVNHTAEVPDLVPDGWLDAGPLDDLPEGRLTRRTVGSVDVVLLRRGRTVHALADRCSHLSGPLSEGELDGDCVVCPWHGSTFALDDGRPVHGPATAPQPAFRTRIVDDRVEVTLSAAR